MFILPYAGDPQVWNSPRGIGWVATIFSGVGETSLRQRKAVELATTAWIRATLRNDSISWTEIGTIHG